MGGVFNGHAHVLARFTIKQVVININMRVLVVREVVINQCLAIDVLGTGHPAREPFSDWTMVNPVLHVTTLPRVVTTFAGLQPTGSIELVCKFSCLKRHVKSFKRRVLCDKGFLWGWFLDSLFGFVFFLAFFPFFLLPVPSKHPIVLGADG